eukprot:GFUD01115845.1.p1 GENE.GFUD01115845.1~~GFUD01115845.1.p1  ORF type:complete len:338 (+),score=57.29 GFUD01115845.1:96-1109(+)
MGSTEKFCLRWNDFESNISVAFQELREDKDFFDVTLACDDEQIQAHKVILSACSPFFRQILKRNRHEHPLLYLKGVKYIDLMSVLNFMYHGEVNVAQDELNSFLAIAEDLKVKGLTQNKSDNVPKQKQEIREIPVPKPQPRAPPERLELTPPPPKRQRPIQVPEPIIHIPVAPSYHQDDEIQEVVPVKSEPISHPQEAQIISDPHPANHIVVDANVDNSMSMYEENYNEYENYEEGNDAAYDGSMMTVANADANKAAEELVLSLMEKTFDENNLSAWRCKMCFKTFPKSRSSNLKDHIESHHVKDLALPCHICLKVFSTNASLRMHIKKHTKQYPIS